MTSDPESDVSMGKDRRLAYAGGQIYGDTVRPEQWTRYFGIDPDACVVKGERFRLRSGRMSSGPGRTGGWSISSEAAVASDLLGPHIRYIVSRLGLSRSGFADLLAGSGARFRVFCYWDNYSGDRIPVIDPDLRDIVALSGGTIEIDEYPKRHAPHLPV